MKKAAMFVRSRVLLASLGILSVLPFGLVLAQRNERPARHASRGLHIAIAAGSDYATEAGMRMYDRGGNAIDIGIAAMFAASVTEFSHFGFGGEAPILIRGKDGQIHAVAGVGTMPKLASADMFRNRPLEYGEMLSPPEKNGLHGMVPVAGLMPALVPGMVEAALVSLREYGTKSFADAAASAIEYADGEAVDELRSMTLEESRPFFDLWPTSKKHWMPEGRVPRPGEIFRQPDLARTLRGMVDAERKVVASGGSRAAGIDAVRDYFYRGAVAHKIDEFSREHRGLLRYEDMAAFRLSPEAALSTNYHGYEVYKPGFWSQGPSMIQALNILNGIDLAQMHLNSAEYINTVTEALKLAYADRDTYYGDPKFSNVPATVLLSQSYADKRRKLIGHNASQQFLPGEINGKTGVHPSLSTIERGNIDDRLMAKDTTCIDVIDENGLMFSSTPSGAWLPSVIAGETGIPLTERAQSFLLVSGHPNELAPGKRPRVTLSPTLVTKDGKAYLAFSTPGGDNQDQSLLQMFLNVVDFHMSAEPAVEAPRFQTRHLVSSFDNHAMNPGDLLLDERIPAAVVEELSNRKHRVETRSRWNSGAAPVMIRVTTAGTLESAADPYSYRSARAW